MGLRDFEICIVILLDTREGCRTPRCILTVSTLEPFTSSHTLV